MAQKTLNAFVVLSGRVDNTFGQIGTTLISMGQTIDQISSKLINFGKESIEVYRGYQDSMLDAEVALSTTYGRGSRELANVMKTLDAQATEWAASTIFHTDDVANAIAQAAHANWDLDMILTGIPNAMRLAQAGSMDLSEAVDFIIKSVNGAGLGFGELTEWIDEWTFAANSSAGDVEEFGEAMLKMGNTMKFAGSKEELLTMLAILHDSGTTGAAAGTLLRNSMLRLIAPTKKAKEAMAELGVTEEEMDEALSEVDGNTEEAVSRLEELGFSVYDDSGKLKDFVTIFHDLGKATEGLSDEDKYAIWSAIFPTRTITGGMALIEALTDVTNELYKALMGGEAEGYGEYAGETMMSGLTGAIETYTSKVERLKQVTGEALEGDVIYWTDKLGGFVDDIATMDEPAFNALVGGLEVIAGAGPGLVAAGVGFRFLGFALGTHAGRIALAALLIGSLANAMKEFDEAKFAENFGTMDLDTQPLIDQLNGIDEKYNESTAYITAFRDALNESVDKYNTAAQTFSSKLLTDMITGNELTDTDLEAYRSYGEQMIGAIKDGIQASADMSAEYWTWLFKGANDAGDEYAENPIFQGLLQLIEEDYEENIAEVEAIGKDLRGAITAAFDNDGKIDDEEYEKIKNYFRQLNEAMARAKQEAENEAEMAAIRADIDKAQNLSYEAMMDYLKDDLYPRRQKKLDEIERTAKEEAFARQIQYERDYAAAETPEEKAAVSQHYNELLGGEYAKDGYLSMEWMEPLVAARMAEVYSWYDPQILRLMEPTLHEGDLGEANALIERLVGNVQSGSMSERDAQNALGESQYSRGTGLFGTGFLGEDSQAAQASEYWQREIAALGGRDAVEQRIQTYRAAGYDDTADQLAMILSKSDFWDNYVSGARTMAAENMESGSYEQMAAILRETNTKLTPEGMLEYMHMAAEEWFIEPDWRNMLGDSFYEQMMEAATGAGFGNIDEWLKNLESTGELTIDATTLQQEPGATLPSQDELARMGYYNLDNGVSQEQSPYTIGFDGTVAPEPYTIPMTVEGAGEAASAARSEAEGILATPINSFVTFPNAGSSASSARSTIQGYFSNPITQHVQVVTHNVSLPGMATGGRATEPVVYGEAGPEWFIPERHDKNTANLIAMAAHASGFSLAELATMGGARMFADGGSFGSSSIPTLETLVWADMDYSSMDGDGSTYRGNKYDVHYAPVIHAENAEGVDRVLSEDKKRLKRLLKELEEERELLGSVVRY